MLCGICSFGRCGMAMLGLQNFRVALGDVRVLNWLLSLAFSLCISLYHTEGSSARGMSNGWEDVKVFNTHCPLTATFIAMCWLTNPVPRTVALCIEKWGPHRSFLKTGQASLLKRNNACTYIIWLSRHLICLPHIYSTQTRLLLRTHRTHPRRHPKWTKC